MSSICVSDFLVSIINILKVIHKMGKGEGNQCGFIYKRFSEKTVRKNNKVLLSLNFWISIVIFSVETPMEHWMK